MMLTLCLLGTTLLVISCRKGNEVVSEFPVDTTLDPDFTFNLDGIPFAYSVLSVDNRYLFTKKGDYYLAIVDNRFQPTSELVRRGNGHEEWLAPFVTGQYEQTGDKTNCYILERTTGSLYSLPLQEGNIGEPIARYRINRAIAFCVNAKRSTLVTLNEDDSNGLCSIYKLE
jgi:hypothetical protein